MGHKIQITVDDQLNRTIRREAKKLGLSVSSYARLALKSTLQKKDRKLLAKAMSDLQSGQVESLTLTDFNNQLDDL